MNRKKALYIVGVYLIGSFLLFPVVLYLYFCSLGGRPAPVTHIITYIVVGPSVFIVPVLLVGLLLLVLYILWWGYRKVTYNTSDTVNRASH